MKGDDPFFDGREFVFGRIKPGETRTFTVPVKLPKDALTRVDPLKLEVTEEHGAKTHARHQRAARQASTGRQRPVSRYAYQLIDDVKGNGDGLMQRGESVRLHVTVKNSGTGKANETLAQLRNLSDEGVFINKGRFNVDNLAPGESKTIDFTFDVRPEYQAGRGQGGADGVRLDAARVRHRQAVVPHRGDAPSRREVATRHGDGRTRRTRRSMAAPTRTRRSWAAPTRARPSS